MKESDRLYLSLCAFLTQIVVVLKVNKNGTAVFCKFHLKTVQGLHNLTAQQAHQLKADDPDYGTRDLYNAIANGDFPKWDMKIQVSTTTFKNTKIPKFCSNFI